MAQFGGGQVQMCDYCHQKPKFLPYNYCGKVCGSRARATGNTPSNTPPMCKQCGQRPVHRGHQFCGRNCANNWQGMNGQINTGGNVQPQQQAQQSWNAMPPPQMPPVQMQPVQIQTPQIQNPPTQGPNQGGGDGGGLKGFVKNLKGRVTQNSQSQKSPPQPSTTPDPSVISPPITPTPSGMSGSTAVSTPSTPGQNQQYHTPPSPTSPGLPDPNGNGQTNGSKSTTTVIASNPSNSSGGDSNNDDFDPYADPNQVQTTAVAVPIQAQAQFSIQVGSPVMGGGGHGNGNWDPNDPNNYPPQQQTRSNISSTCRLNGCDNPVFVDPVTRRPGEYCSQRHREDAAAYGQASPCIMCLKMPRGQKDHFCSRACREKALRP